MRKLVPYILETGAIDAVHADQLSMAQFALARGKNSTTHHGKKAGPNPVPLLVFDAHNAVWTIMDRLRQTAPWYLRPVIALEARRTKRFEGWVLAEYEHTLAVAEPDRKALEVAWQSSLNGEIEQRPQITVVPIAVDAEQLQPVNRSPGSQNIVTMGTLHYPPNADGIRWFAREVFPLVRQQAPAARLTIIGKNPPPDFLQMQAGDPEAVQVTGYVPDLVPYLERSGVMVVAVRAGGGMRVRILEAFARGVPVVTTTVGLEGIDAEPGRDVLVADTPQEFAGQVVRLLGDPQLQQTISENGRCLVEARYDWRVILGKMGEIYPSPIVTRTSERLPA
jgi:glycosyltransferase involved in cell wall biosynthesis